ncbi:MAG: prolipoprotein diacylglyceryl transferase [Lachnospiraceae bacterium]|nr:prolipoprotein diacylglyceryl transferase [Lachnospiraceae bacterium]
MHKEIFSIGSVTVYGYGLMIALGIILIFIIFLRLAPKYGLDPDIYFNGGVIGVITGLIGAKVMYWIIELDEVIKDPSMLLRLDGGFVVYGGLIVGITVPIIYICGMKKLPILPAFDIAAMLIPFGQGFGRIGCLLSGCCYGRPVPEGAWYGITFPAGADAPAGIPLYPTQIMSFVFDFLLCAFLFYRMDRNKFRGQNLALYMIIYSVGRFIVEFFRGDDRGDYLFGVLSPSQAISIVTLVGGIIVYIYFRNKALSPLKVLKEEAAAAAAAKKEAEE